MQPCPWRGLLFLGLRISRMVDVATRRLGRVTQEDAVTSDLRRENHCRTLNALPVARYWRYRAMREALPLALSGLFKQGNIQLATRKSVSKLAPRYSRGWR